MRTTRSQVTGILIALAGVMIGCPQMTPVDNGDGVVSDFSNADVNPNSARYQQAVSPRDYTGQISAWYFGHAT